MGGGSLRERLLEICRGHAAELERDTLTAELTLGGYPGAGAEEVMIDGEPLGIEITVVG